LPTPPQVLQGLLYSYQPRFDSVPDLLGNHLADALLRPLQQWLERPRKAVITRGAELGEVRVQRSKCHTGLWPKCSIQPNSDRRAGLPFARLNNCAQLAPTRVCLFMPECSRGLAVRKTLVELW